jgi:SAM-dependent methyltransferase
MQNAFGAKIPSIREILSDPALESALSSRFQPVLVHLGVTKERAGLLIAQCIALAKNESMETYEAKAHALMETAGVMGAFPKRSLERTCTVVGQVTPYLCNGPVLDLGCGDGQVGRLLSQKGFNVTLADVYEHPHIRGMGLPFKRFAQAAPIPFSDGSFDNIVAITVFHCSANLMQLVHDAARLIRKGGRVLVIESVYGARGAGISKKRRMRIAEYLSLDKEQQRLYNIFVDHFYYPVLYYSADAEKPMDAHYNFNTPDGWKGLFENCGLTQEEMVHLGFDQPIVLKYHTLHVLRKE